MNKEKFKQLKAYYEQSLTDALAPLFGVEKSALKVSYTVDETIIEINKSHDNVINVITLTYNEDLFITAISANLLQNGGIVVGSAAAPFTVSTETMIILRNGIGDILNSEPTENTETAGEPEPNA